MKKNHSLRGAGIALVLGVVLSLGTLSAHADNMYWLDPAGGDFNTPVNWSTGVPGTNDTAWFNLTNETYTVDLATAVTNAGLQVLNGTVTLDLGGNLYTADVLDVARGTQAASSTLIVTNGDLLTTEAYMASSPRTGTMIVTGQGTTWTNTGTGGNDLWIGHTSTGTLIVTNQAQVSLAAYTVARYSGAANSEIHVGGEGSLLTLAGGNLGRFGGSVNISDKATLNLTGNISQATEDNSVATLTVDNATVTQDGQISMATTATDNTATIRLINGATYTHDSTAYIRIGGASSSGPSNSVGNLVVESGSLFDRKTGGVTYLGYNGVGNLAVRGTDSRVLINDGNLHMIYHEDASATILVETGGLLRVSGYLEHVVGSGSGTHSTVDITVQGALARLEAGGLYLGQREANDTTRGSGALTVADHGSVSVAGEIRVALTSGVALDGGSITANDFTLRAGATLRSTLDVTLHAHQADASPMIMVTNNAGIAGAFFNLSLGDYTPDDSVFTLMRINGTRTGLFVDSLGDDILDGDKVWEDALDPDNFYVVLNYIDGTNGDPSYITLTAIPEPGVLALLGLSLLLLVRRRRRR